MQAVGKAALPEVWYSLVRAMDADGDDLNASEANTEESLLVRFPRVCRGPQGWADENHVASTASISSHFCS